MAELTSPSAGDSITAAWGQGVADRVNPYGCILKRTGAALSVNDATDTAVTFPAGSVTEELDTDGFHDTGSNTARITIPTGGDGWYLVFANVSFAQDNDGQRHLWIELNGTAGAGTFKAYVTQDTTVGAICRMHTSAVISLAATDYVAMGVRHNAGAATDLTVEGSGPRFGCVRLWKT